MITMKRRHIILCSVLLFLSMGAMAQTPTITYDGKKLTVNVPTGMLHFQKDDLNNEAIRESFVWLPDNTCFFMGRPEPYIIYPQGLSTDETVTLLGLFNEEAIEIPVEMRPAVPQPTGGETPEGGKKMNSYTLLYIIIGAVLLALLVLILLLRRRKDQVKPQPQYDPNVISIIKDETVQYEHGLAHVKERPHEYLTFDMDMVFADTTINKVYLSTTLVKKLYDFFTNSLEEEGRTKETGCFILGCWDFESGNSKRYDISLEQMVEPGDDADFEEYSLSFGKKIGVAMNSIIDDLAKKSKRDYVQTCWMHSHPGLGLFLSNQDLIVQKKLTYPDHKNRLLAIVIDTNTPDFKTGFFTPKADGSMNNQEDVKRWFSFEEIYREGREQKRSEPKAPQPSNFSADPDYFNIALEGETSGHIGFSAHAINQIDTTLYSCVKGVVGYFFGEEAGRYLKVANCLPYENEEKMGCLLYGDGLDAAQIESYQNDLANCKFFLSCSSDDRIGIWMRNRAGGFAQAGETTLTQMKEWIRRKRV